jgi:hypothetical protein
MEDFAASIFSSVRFVGEFLYTEDDGRKPLHIGNYLPIDMASRSIRFESPSTPLWETQNLQIHQCLHMSLYWVVCVPRRDITVTMTNEQRLRKVEHSI